MTYQRSAFLSCALAAMCVFHPITANAQSADRAGHVAEINKTGFQYHPGGVDFLDQGDTIVRNARLETDLVGEMALAMEDGTQLVMPPNSEIEIDRFVYDPDRSVGQAVISLGRGALRMVSGRLRSDSYQVNTPVATIGVRGTDFTVELVPGSGMVVRVDDGAVEIRPNRTPDIFIVPFGQVWICSDSSCRAAASGDQPVRRASLGPPRPTAKDPNSGAVRGAVTRSAKAGDSRQNQSLDASQASNPGSRCPAYEIPDWAYQRVGLNPTEWPRAVTGITHYHQQANGLAATHYCPDRVEFAGSETSFSVLGDAGPGDTRILYFVNTLPGQEIFQPGFDDRAKETDDAAAYTRFMSRVFDDQSDYAVASAEASLARAAPDQIVLTQRALTRLRHGEHLVSGITLYRPVTGTRTALFSIPAVVTPRPSGSAHTAPEVADALFKSLPYRVAIELKD